jgi:hypothetical protein
MNRPAANNGGGTLCEPIPKTAEMMLQFIPKLRDSTFVCLACSFLRCHRGSKAALLSKLKDKLLGGRPGP